MIRTHHQRPFSKATFLRVPSAARRPTQRSEAIQIPIGRFGKVEDISDEELRTCGSAVIGILKKLTPAKMTLLFSPEQRRGDGKKPLVIAITKQAILDTFSPGQKFPLRACYGLRTILVPKEAFATENITHDFLHETHHAVLDFLSFPCGKDHLGANLTDDIAEILLAHRARQFQKCGFGRLEDLTVKPTDAICPDKESIKHDLNKVLQHFVSLYALLGTHAQKFDGNHLNHPSHGRQTAEELLVESWASFILDPQILNTRDPKLFAAIVEVENFLAYHNTLGHEDLKSILLCHLTP